VFQALKPIHSWKVDIINGGLPFIGFNEVPVTLFVSIRPGTFGGHIPDEEMPIKFKVFVISQQPSDKK